MWTGHARLVWIQTLWFWVPSAAPSASPVTGDDFQGKGLRGPAKPLLVFPAGEQALPTRPAPSASREA